MDLAQFKKMLDAHGREKCLQIIFDNGRVWLTFRPKMVDPKTDPIGFKRGYPLRDEKGKIQFFGFDDLVRINEDRETVSFIEHQHGVDFETSQKIYWEIENPIEGIQGLAFAPDDMTDEEIYRLKVNWDHTIT